MNQEDVEPLFGWVSYSALEPNCEMNEEGQCSSIPSFFMEYSSPIDLTKEVRISLPP